MGNTTIASPNQPPRYEELSIDKCRPSASPCLCHRRYHLLAEMIVELAEPILKRKPTTIYQEWEIGRIKALLGTVLGSSFNDCKYTCMCHEEYALLSSRVMAMRHGLKELGKSIAAQENRTVAEIMAWERHAGDIKCLAAMLRDCWETEVQTALPQEVENAEPKHKLDALGEKIEKLLLK